MQALPGDGLRKVGRGGVQRGAREPGRIAAVERIAEQRMAEGGKVHADLVRAPGTRRDAQERAAIPLGEDGIVRDGRLTAGRDDAPGRTVVRAGDGQVDRAARRQPRAAGDGEIGAPEIAAVQHAAQPVVHVSAAGDEHDARRAAIEPVDGVKHSIRQKRTGNFIRRHLVIFMPARQQRRL